MTAHKHTRAKIICIAKQKALERQRDEKFCLLPFLLSDVLRSGLLQIDLSSSCIQNSSRRRCLGYMLYKMLSSRTTDCLSELFLFFNHPFISISSLLQLSQDQMTSKLNVEF